MLHVDGYAGFEKLVTRDDVILAACWAHTRRNFYEVAAQLVAESESPHAVHGEAALGRARDRWTACHPMWTGHRHALAGAGSDLSLTQSDRSPAKIQECVPAGNCAGG